MLHSDIFPKRHLTHGTFAKFMSYVAFLHFSREDFMSYVMFSHFTIYILQFTFYIFTERCIGVICLFR